MTATYAGSEMFRQIRGAKHRAKPHDLTKVRLAGYRHSVPRSHKASHPAWRVMGRRLISTYDIFLWAPKTLARPSHRDRINKRHFRRCLQPAFDKHQRQEPPHIVGFRLKRRPDLKSMPVSALQRRLPAAKMREQRIKVAVHRRALISSNRRHERRQQTNIFSYESAAQIFGEKLQPTPGMGLR